MRTFFGILLFVFSSITVFAQRVVICSSEDGKPISRAELLENGRSIGVYSSVNGVMLIPSDLSNKLSFYALGFRVLQKDVAAITDGDTLFMQPLAYNLRGVSVIEDSLNGFLKIETGTIQLDAGKVSKIPTLFAEPDLLKAIQLLPGVSSVMENNVTPFVRGGKGSHTAVRVDGATLYNPAHSVGFFSIIHPSGVKSITMHTDGISSSYGGRASSYLDIKLKDGNEKKLKANASFGLISSYADIQAPLLKGERPISFQITGRTTYIDKTVKIISRGNDELPFNTGFSDANAKINFGLSNNKKLSLAGYFSTDNYRFDNAAVLNFGHETKWNNYLVNLSYENNAEKWYKKTSLSFSSYNIDKVLVENAKHESGIMDLKLSQIFNSYNKKSVVQKVGGELELHRISLGNLSINGSDFFNFTEFNLGIERALSSALFVDLSKSLSPNYELKANLRLSSFITSSSSFGYPEPRLSLTRKTGSSGKISLSYDRLVQYLRLYSANITPMPTDAWIPSSEKLKPIKMDGFTLSHYLQLNNKNISVKTAGFYRMFSNVSDVLEGASSFTEPNYENRLEIGESRAMGFEFLIQKNAGIINGWLSYTFSRVVNSIGSINNGNSYNAYHDKPHILNIVINKRLKKWEFNALFVLQSGRPFTLVEKGIGILNFYSDRNAYRLPAYHRLDLSIIRYQKRHKHFQSSWILSVYNTYNRKNVFSVLFNPYSGTNTALTLFPILPMIGYKVSFF